MSQRKRRSESQSKAAANQSRQPESDGDDDVTFTQPSSSQVQQARKLFTPAQINLKVAEVVQFILIKDQRKVPIRRADIVKLVIKEYKTVCQDIMKGVAHTLDQVFGLNLVEIDPKIHVYILVNKLESNPGLPVSLTSADPKHGLLFVILSIIFMKGGVLKEVVVWTFLKKLRVDPGEPHHVFGDVKKLVTDEFVRQKYLEYVKIPHTDPVEFELRWGMRANQEISKMKLIETIGNLFDQEPQTWMPQYREAQAAANRAQSSQ